MKDRKPDVWIGHVFMKSRDVPASKDFLLKIGMREIFTDGKIGVFELRAGTHLVLQPGEPESNKELYFDLMVEDLAASRERYVELGLNPTEIKKGRIHSAFLVTEPGGNLIRFNSTHASKYPV